MPKLLRPAEMPHIPRMNMPNDFYVVLEEPALLAGMSYPSSNIHWRDLSAAGFIDVVCLCESPPNYRPGSLRIAYANKLEDLHYGHEPADPGRQEMLVSDAVRVVLQSLDAGHGVIVHCVGGIGRTGTVIGCTLRALGVPADTVIRYLDDLTKARGIKRGWPETVWQERIVRNYYCNNTIDPKITANTVAPRKI
jgi:hypothetical protein